MKQRFVRFVTLYTSYARCKKWVGGVRVVSAADTADCARFSVKAGMAMKMI
jgi:hypothetical protein